jgi:hypothetical protein
MRWPFTFKVKKLPKGFGGMVNGFVIRILEKYWEDEGLYQHELLHVKQFFFRGLIVHLLRYRFSESYRYDCEVECYRKQLEYSGTKYRDDRHLFARYVQNLYGLDVSEMDVWKDLG